MKSAEQIKQDVVNQLTWDTRVNANDINVKVDTGKVTLTGNVDTFTEKRTAANIARSVIGVSLVDNQLDVVFPSTFTVPTDQDIKDNIERRLVWNSIVNSDDVRVIVDGGLVTLEGSVQTYQEKLSAEIEAEQTSGVLDVTNKLVVVPSEEIADEVVGERIMDKIEFNTLTDVDKVDVEVEDGEVTLSGNVSSWESWRAAYDAAQFTTGVKEVDDQLIIKY